MHILFLFLTLPLLLISSCALHEDTYYTNGASIARINGFKDPELSSEMNFASLGMKIDFQGTDGWRFIPAPDEYRFLKKYDDKSWHTAAIRIYQIHPPKTEFNNPNEFYTLIKNDLESLRDKSGNDLVFMLEESKKVAPLCILMHKKTHVTDLVHPMSNPLVLDVYEHICKHPFRDGVFVNIHYSERFESKEKIIDVEQRANSIFGKIKFET